MENKDNIAGLGKNHDKAAQEHDIAKKQSQAQPAAENLDMEPNSVNMQGNTEFSTPENTNKEAENTPTPEQGQAYADQEHKKAEDWENTNETGPDSPQF